MDLLGLPLDPILAHLAVHDLARMSCVSHGLRAAVQPQLAAQTQALRDELQTVMRDTVLCGGRRRTPSGCIPDVEWVLWETSGGPTAWLGPKSADTYDLCFRDGWMLHGWMQCGPARVRHGPCVPHHLSGLPQHRPGFEVRDLPTDHRAKHAVLFIAHLSRTPYPDM